MKYSEIKTIGGRVKFLREKLSTNATWALRGLTRVYAEQTADEQRIGDTRVHNGVGFSGVDGEILSSFAQQVERGRTMSPKQMAVIFKKMPRYAKQLEKLTRPVEEKPVELKSDRMTYMPKGLSKDFEDQPDLALEYLHQTGQLESFRRPGIEEPR